MTVPASPLYHPRGFRSPPLDDRGERFRLAPKPRLVEHYPRGTRRFFALRSRLSRAGICARPQRMLGPMPISTAAMLGAALLGVLLITLAMLTPFSGLWAMGIALVTLITTACVLTYHRQFATRSIVAMSALAEGVCPCCAFSLAGLSPEADNCLICPECGHAWNTLRLVRPHWETLEGEPPKSHLDPRLDLRSGLLYNAFRRRAADDCGRCVHALNPWLWTLAPEIRQQHRPETLRTFIADLRRPGRNLRLIVTLIAASACVAGLVFWVFPAFGEHTGGAIFASVIFGLLLLGVMLIPSCSLGISPLRTAHTLCTHGVCGSCVNDLRSTAPNANAMRVCDRCRASWLDARFPPRAEPPEPLSETQAAS